MLDGVVVPVQQMLYSLLYLFAEIMWGINQAILFVGYYILSITAWLSEQMFQPLLTSIGGATDSLLLPVFTLAMITLAITYLLGVFGVFRVVEFKSAVVWMLVSVMWFQFGPELYAGFEQFRRDLSGGFYATVFTDVTGNAGTIEGLGAVGDAGDMEVSPPKNNFQLYLSFDNAIDGLDIAMAYLNADGCDVLRGAGCGVILMPDGSAGRLPFRWYTADEYYDFTRHGVNFPYFTQAERQVVLDDAARGIWIGFSGIVLSLFGMVEQIVQLLLTIAFGIAFASFFIAVLFAFFKKTESVTWAVFDIILGLFIQSIITSLLLALVMAFVTVAGGTGNGILLLGTSFLGIILITILLIGAVQAILGALNGLMGAFGQATGGNLDAAGSITRVAGAYASGGATLAAGGSISQAAGAALGPGAAQKAYYASRTFGNDSVIGRAAQGVAEGATAAYIGPVGGYLLGRQNGTQNVGDMTLGTQIRANGSTQAIGPNLTRLASEGADIRVDPLTQQPYAFEDRANGQGLRTYEDGSKLNTTMDDEPLSRDRAKEERQARRDQEGSDSEGMPASLSGAAIAQIDASDDDENADLLAAVRAGNNSAGTASEGDAETPTIVVNNDDSSSDVSSTSDGGTDTSSAGSSVAPEKTSDSATDDFLRSIELDYPGSTGRDDLVERVYPEGQTTQPPQTVSVPIEVENITVDLVNDDVTNVPQVGLATQDRLAGAGIETAGQLANASPQDLSAVGIGQRRSEFLIGQAQSYIAPSDAPGSADASQIASAIDSTNNDDAVRLATRVGAAVQTSMSTQSATPRPTEAIQIAADAGLPNTPESGQFIQAASAMGLNGQQAQAVIQDVQNNNAIGTEVAQGVRASLAGLSANGGPQLNNAQMDQAVGLLEQAGRQLVNAASTMNANAGGNSEPRDTATAGSTRPVTTN